ncbi:histone-lysine N-methyltransferase ATXR2-like isoform X2 [Magnolia sinica]|uniref:histone-lysine N-methyltransferase ATXR2-like isoform X2 n=1 Tax=Magnolia sinica TaxID=86752 RepID=UPI00265B2BBB|nr:histone-lysine N-methyltransferase ATXR2-like isoform X2 [Magnolia sinica]
MASIICPLDKEYSDIIAALLATPSPQSSQDYYDQLITERRCHGLEIKQSEEHGKAVYASLEFKEGELVFRDQMLVGAQHSSNKVDCLVCSYFFCYIGSIEFQIGRKLYLQSLGLPANTEHDHETSSHSLEEACLVELSDEEDNTPTVNHDSLQSCSSSNMKNNNLVPKEVLEALVNGSLALPHSKQFTLPSVIPCPQGCEEEHYCSKLCAEADWELFHSLLCTGESSRSSRQEALVKFIEHANRTNDIFLLAAKVISFMILRYKKLKSHHQDQKQPTTVNGVDDSRFRLLLEAWKPISMGFKRRWWDCIALPDDVDCHDETSFRQQIKELAFTSLQLLKEAIFDKEYAPLFSLEIYGHIIGMFELNNLDLVVASPVEDYFIYIDDLPYPDKEEAEKVTQPFLDALGDDYSVCCQGTAFFPIQSCMNHSCYPNAKAFKRDEDRDGEATIIALRPILKGEEITISYIDEDLPYKERQALLADYGFRCRCPKCLEEA